jgi:hypothetical protein
LLPLVAYIKPRLAALGWSDLPPSQEVSFPPGYTWIKTLSNGTKANLNVTQEGGTASTSWQFDAIAQPIGKPASY